MKFVFMFLIIGLIFAPGYAFAWKSLAYNNANECSFVCDTPYIGIDHASPINFLLLAATSIIGLGVYYLFTKTRTYAVFSLQCDNCDRKTNGLKCTICEEEKQKVS